MRSRASRVVPVLGAVLALAGWCLPAVAADAPSAREKGAAQVAAEEAKPTPDQKQVVDREAKRAALVAVVAPLVERNPKNVQVTRTESGALLMKFRSGYMNTAIARRNADGSISTSCVESTDELKSFLEAPDAATPATQATKREDK